MDAIVAAAIGTPSHANTTTYGPTPQAAFARVLDEPHRSNVRILRVNIVGSFATIESSGAIIEGEPLRDAVLLQRFSFGWQLIELANVGCYFSLHGITPEECTRLMLGMPKPGADRECDRLRSDSGPQRDVDAVRPLMTGPFVPYVAAYGDFALGAWYGAGGGETIFEREHGRWVRIHGGGGAFGVVEMHDFGIPEAAWCRFGIYDARCPPAKKAA